MTYLVEQVANKVAGTRQPSIVAIFCFSLIAVALCINSMITYRYNIEEHKRIYYPHFKERFNLKSENYTLVYASMALLLTYSYIFVIGFLLYSAIKRNKHVIVYKKDIINKTLPICVASVCWPFFVILFNFDENMSNMILGAYIIGYLVNMLISPEIVMMENPNSEKEYMKFAN